MKLCHNFIKLFERFDVRLMDSQNFEYDYASTIECCSVMKLCHNFVKRCHNFIQLLERFDERLMDSQNVDYDYA